MTMVGMRTIGRAGRRLAIAVAILLPIGTVGCGEGDQPGGGEVPVTVAAWTVAADSITVERQWHGRLEPLRSYAVQAPREGRIATVAVRDGDLVRAGDLLLRMEGPDLEARRGVLNERLEFLESELERWRTLAEKGAAGPAEISAASLRVLEARDETSQLESHTESYLVRAPASGVVNGTTVSRGTNATNGQILLYVEDRAALGVRLIVPALETSFLEEAGRLTLQDDRGNEFPIERVVISSDPHPSFVRADLFVRGTGGHRAATVRYRSAEEALSVPWTAVASDGDRHWVAVILDGEPQRVERRHVELGRAHDGGIEVRSGLAPGDRVVRYEPRSLADGRAVLPRELAGGGTP
jgi:multidrug efflux system membrane fusion protein